MKLLFEKGELKSAHIRTNIMQDNPNTAWVKINSSPDGNSFPAYSWESLYYYKIKRRTVCKDYKEKICYGTISKVTNEEHKDCSNCIMNIPAKVVIKNENGTVDEKEIVDRGIVQLEANNDNIIILAKEVQDKFENIVKVYYSMYTIIVEIDEKFGGWKIKAYPANVAGEDGFYIFSSEFKEVHMKFVKKADFDVAKL